MMRPVRLGLAIAVVALGGLLSGCERPDMETVQGNYRGLGIEQVINPRIAAERLAANQAPPPVPPVPEGGPRASEVFKNVQVLGDLSANEFSRLMVAITQWVSPKQSCTYCHVGDLASDAVYTKVVARRMIQMVQEVNSGWQSHVRGTGVTCYTCHRGEPLPTAVWAAPADTQRFRVLGAKAGQNTPAMTVGLTSLPYDPFSAFLTGSEEIRVQSATALPTTDHSNIMDAEWTYGLMMHVSQSLGVNCGYCHNSRSFMPWEASSPARVNAWHAIRMVREINNDYLTPLTSIVPANRKGPAGDIYKVNCETCHRGLAKPLQGAAMAQSYHGLGMVHAAAGAASAPVPEPVSAPASPEAP